MPFFSPYPVVTQSASSTGAVVSTWKSLKIVGVGNFAGEILFLLPYKLESQKCKGGKCRLRKCEKSSWNWNFPTFSSPTFFPTFVQCAKQCQNTGGSFFIIFLHLCKRV